MKIFTLNAFREWIMHCQIYNSMSFTLEMRINMNSSFKSEKKILKSFTILQIKVFDLKTSWICVSGGGELTYIFLTESKSNSLSQKLLLNVRFYDSSHVCFALSQKFTFYLHFYGSVDTERLKMFASKVHRWEFLLSFRLFRIYK